MIPAIVVFLYLAAVLYIGIFAFRRARGKEEAEDYFLASRSLGPFVFLFSLFGTNMTAFAILGSSGHAFSNGIVTFGLMASSSGLVIPLTIFLIGTRVWALGKKYGFMTPVQMFRDRWECTHIGTVIFAVQAAMLVPYIIIGIMGGGTTLYTISGGVVPFWFGGAIVAMVVMSYVFFGGMRGTAWVNTFQTILFLCFGAIALIVIGVGMGGFRSAAQAMQASPLASLLTRERISPYYFFSYTFIPLSAIAFPHILIFCLTARKISQFRKTVIFYPICIMAIWLPCVFLGVMANRVTDVPQIRAKQEARRVLATQGRTMEPEQRDELREQVGRRRRDHVAAATVCATLACRIARRGHHGGGDGQRFTNSRSIDYVHGGRLRLLRGQVALRGISAGADRSHLHNPDNTIRLCCRLAGAGDDLRAGDSVCVLWFRFVVAAFDRCVVLERKHEVGRAGGNCMDSGGSSCSCNISGGCTGARAWSTDNLLVAGWN